MIYVNLKEYQSGKVDVIPYENIVIICKQERKNLKPNIYINSKFLSIGESIRGNIIITCKNENNFKSLGKKQAIKCLEFLKRSSFNYDNLKDIRKYVSNKKIKNRNQFIIERSIEDNETSNNSNNNSETLQMILAIQNAILQFIKNSKN